MPNAQARTARRVTVDPSEATSSRQLGEDMIQYAKQYAREKPELVALWCFGIGFIVGWKLKPW